ncbi:MAG TPA: CBS domain-containing protein [Thermomicrobiales bacterium]|nr:CBS domain-containing protein [Thermomicrobiales bacterium]
MENVTSASIGDMLTPSIDTITPDDTVTVAKRRMESQTARSLIVVDDNRPVGVIQWRGLARHEGSELVRDVMLTEFPVLRAGMSVDDVRSYLSGVDVDLDHLPVVDESGMLLGEVPRGMITKSETATNAATEAVVAGPEVDPARHSQPQIHLEQGMKVVGAAGKNLGSVDEIDQNAEGHISHFTVKYGMLGRNSKRLPADVINRVEGNEVHLSLDQPEFKMLADVGEEVV